MATLDRTTIDTYDINDVNDMLVALEQFEETVASESGYLSFIFMTSAQKNVDRAKLVKIELGDGSFAYEVELV